MTTHNAIANAGRFLVGWARRITRPVRRRREDEPVTPPEEQDHMTVLAVISALADPRCPGSDEILALIQEQRQREEAGYREELAQSPARPQGPAYSAFDPGLMFWMREDAVTVGRAWQLSRRIVAQDKEVMTGRKKR